MIYFTSDQHFKHHNILKYCKNREYKNSHEMDKDITNKYNSIVKEEDEVFMIGDFCLDSNPEIIASYLNKLNGNKHLILGNHDRLKPFQYVEAGFTSVHTSLIVDGLVLAHDPSMAIALFPGKTLLHGHVHGLWKYKIADTGVKLYNVGVDAHDMYPCSIEEIKNVIQSR